MLTMLNKVAGAVELCLKMSPKLKPHREIKNTPELRPPRNWDHRGIKTTAELRPPRNSDHPGIKTTLELRSPRY